MERRDLYFRQRGRGVPSFKTIQSNHGCILIAILAPFDQQTAKPKKDYAERRRFGNRVRQEGQFGIDPAAHWSSSG